MYEALNRPNPSYLSYNQLVTNIKKVFYIGSKYFLLVKKLPYSLRCLYIFNPKDDMRLEGTNTNSTLGVPAATSTTNPAQPVQDVSADALRRSAYKVMLLVGDQLFEATTLVTRMGRYEGQVQQGKPHGFGKETYASGASYCGAWTGGVQEGWGVLAMPASGLTFTGLWHAGKKEGLFQVKDDKRKETYHTFYKNDQQTFNWLTCLAIDHSSD